MVEKKSTRDDIEISGLDYFCNVDDLDQTAVYNVKEKSDSLSENELNVSSFPNEISLLKYDVQVEDFLGNHPDDELKKKKKELLSKLSSEYFSSSDKYFTQKQCNIEDVFDHLSQYYIMNTNDTSQQQLTKEKKRGRPPKKIVQTSLNCNSAHNKICLTELNIWKSFIQHKNKYNLLFYGLGSKHDFLDKFRDQSLLDDFPYVVTFYAAHSEANFKLFLQKLVEFIQETQLKKKLSIQNLLHALTTTLEMKFALFNQTPALCICIHDFDFSSLYGFYGILAELANHSLIRFIVTVTNIRYPLLWSPSEWHSFRFLHLHVPTYEPYFVDIIYKWSIPGNLWMNMYQNETIFSIQSVNSMIFSMPNKHKSLFYEALKLASTDKNERNHLMVKVPTHKLYKKCKDKLLVSDKKSFEEILREFVNQNLFLIANDKKIIKLAIERDVIDELINAESHIC